MTIVPKFNEFGFIEASTLNIILEVANGRLNARRVAIQMSQCVGQGTSVKQTKRDFKKFGLYPYHDG